MVYQVVLDFVEFKRASLKLQNEVEIFIQERVFTNKFFLVICQEIRSC